MRRSQFLYTVHCAAILANLQDLVNLSKQTSTAPVSTGQQSSKARRNPLISREVVKYHQMMMMMMMPPNNEYAVLNEAQIHMRYLFRSGSRSPTLKAKRQKSLQLGEGKSWPTSPVPDIHECVDCRPRAIATLQDQRESEKVLTPRITRPKNQQQKAT